MRDDDTTVKLVASTDPNLTAVAAVKREPLIVTVVPPAAGPLFGLTEEMLGAATYVYSEGLVAADVPLGVVTRTFTVPELRFGATAVI
jgi:hypothetical protein